METPHRDDMRLKRPVFIGTALFTLGFIGIAAAVRGGATAGFDRHVLLSLRDAANPGDPLGPPWFEEMIAEISVLGSYTIIVIAALSLAAALVILKLRRAALTLLLSLAGGSALSTVSKLYFDRPRPDLVDALDRTFTASFPSGHAMISMLAWMTMASVISCHVDNPALRRLAIGLAFSISLAVGLSRVYLGVHWPSDVLAGWCLGLTWAGITWLADHALAGK